MFYEIIVYIMISANNISIRCQYKFRFLNNACIPGFREGKWLQVGK